MRRILPAALTVLATATAAQAQPALTEGVPPPAPVQPSWVMTAGPQLGGIDGLLAGGVVVEVGHRLDDTLWLHGLVAGGSTAVLWSSGSGNYQQALLGLEERTCRPNGHACMIAGIDAGIQHAKYAGTGIDFFDDSAQMLSVEATSPVVALRLGADLGSTLRYRPAIEVPITRDGAGVQVVFGFGFAL